MQQKSTGRCSSSVRMTTWKMLWQILALADGAGDLLQQVQARQLRLQPALGILAFGDVVEQDADLPAFRPADPVGAHVVVAAQRLRFVLEERRFAGHGLGFLLGDGNLNYAREDIVEGYYNLHAWRGIYYALDGQFIEHPGYNKDRGPVFVESVRMHVDF